VGKTGGTQMRTKIMVTAGRLSVLALTVAALGAPKKW
jgi:hypothetical protein